MQREIFTSFLKVAAERGILDSQRLGVLARVTGIPDATSLIHTGESVTVDGYPGIVTTEPKKDYKCDRKAP